MSLEVVKAKNVKEEQRTSCNQSKKMGHPSLSSKSSRTLHHLEHYFVSCIVMHNVPTMFALMAIAL